MVKDHITVYNAISILPEAKEFDRITGIVATNSGEVFLVDHNANKLSVCNVKDDNKVTHLINTKGKPLEGRAEDTGMWCPTGIALAGNIAY
eukprot:CAMPEP_0168535398 /NCGR_PEP_ID=MMETSP0405-20121227/18661_1 /TAXON_ID=498012 /ORGANISM="Trichosphaerium sp, Strain Am-I-7 wt" /LENGTH=90 /DNA_ID=CAMNT_0008562667 /DNA_START=178 /DNA_END=447 /DNA_ORIENTATION=+